MTKSKGSRQAALRFIVSRTAPMLTAPSPKKVTATSPVPARRCANAAPAASGTPPPTMALVPRTPASGHLRCIDPPRPLQNPSAKPAISASVRCRRLSTSGAISAVGSKRSARKASAFARKTW